ncbi:PREDICTED: putative F-box only protein 15 [Camelina sativa]|uniref:F-box only protein 15 n=1 Tax=Camelina sativa TaxID=90675 RepID=A0ABM0SZX7_CAMSA|nr:PREDICTED: putative F-box only protein 15 [Camelina sativa]
MAQAPANRRVSSLPSELIEEILCRTPVESLLRFKTTCKQWYALLSSNTKFMQKQLDHHSHTSERFLRIDNDQSVQIMDLATRVLSNSPIPDVFLYPYPISYMVHCDGLMLCRCDDLNHGRDKYVRMAVWNPFLRKVKWIQPLVCYEKMERFGIGYNTASRDNYKILRYGYKKWFPRVKTCEIYEFKTDSWRGTEAEFDADVAVEWGSVSVKGNMYWIAAKKRHYFILSFDFSMETFKDICDCPPFWNCRRLGCFSGDRLSLLIQDGGEARDIKVWMTNKLSDEVVSLTNYFNVTSRPGLPRLQLNPYSTRPGYSIGKHRNIMAWSEGYVQEAGVWYTSIKFYEIDEDRVGEPTETGKHLQGDYHSPLVCSYVYVPSLIPVPEQ